MTVGENIKACRRDAGMTQKDLAEAIGTTQKIVSRYETGAIKNIPLLKIRRIADALEVSPKQLMGWE